MISLRLLSKKYIQLALSVLLLSNSFHTHANNFKAFTANSFEEIKALHQDQEFLIGLWSVDCPPCMVELQYMAKLLELNPEIPYVLISTDTIEQSQYAAVFLEDAGLSDRESWMFADSFVEQLRFSIDPNWYGELPRSYFFDKNHTMRSHSGIVSEDLLRGWFSTPLRFK